MSKDTTALLAIVIVGPHVTIWALNTLFDLSLGHGFWNWLAAAWLNTLVYGASKK